VAELFQQLSIMVICMVTGFQGSHEVLRIADFCVEIQTWALLNIKHNSNHSSVAFSVDF